MTRMAHAVVCNTRSATWCPMLALVLLLPTPAGAQQSRLQLDHLNRLAGQATETVDVTLDASMLQLAGRFMSADQPDQAAVKELLSGLQGIYVKSFEFTEEGAYTAADLEAVRGQLRDSRWSRLINVQGKRESVEIYMWRDGERSGGLAILAAEPRELTIVNIVGEIDLSRLASLQGQFGIPRLPTAGDVAPKEPK